MPLKQGGVGQALQMLLLLLLLLLLHGLCRRVAVPAVQTG